MKKWKTVFLLVCAGVLALAAAGCGGSGGSDGKTIAYVAHDKQTGFISEKSKDGRELKALEHPGLWNGAMSDWNTVFVDVESSTFTPVKTVNDLLRPEHRM